MGFLSPVIQLPSQQGENRAAICVMQQLSGAASLQVLAAMLHWDTVQLVKETRQPGPEHHQPPQTAQGTLLVGEERDGRGVDQPVGGAQ